MVERPRGEEPRENAASYGGVEHHHVDAFDLLAAKSGRKLSPRVLFPKSSTASTLIPLFLHAASISTIVRICREALMPMCG
jgi:hypothetical protein